MEEEEKVPVWAEKLMSRLDELEKKLEEKKEEKPLFAALRAELDMEREMNGLPPREEKKNTVDARFQALRNDLDLSK
jgi:fructose-bisphosphate aldolase class 1